MEESAKHQAWSGLGNMSPMEAMRLFVRTLEEEQVRACPAPHTACTKRPPAVPQPRTLLLAVDQAQVKLIL